MLLPPLTFTVRSQSLNPAFFTETVCSPSVTCQSEAALPTKLPSIAMSAPGGVDSRCSFAESRAFARTGIDNDVQYLRRHSDFHRRPAHVLAVCIDVEGCLSLHPKAIGLKILYFANIQVAAEIDGGKEAEQLEGIKASNDTRVELAVVHDSLRRDLHAAPVSRGVGESRQHRRLVAACEPCRVARGVRVGGCVRWAWIVGRSNPDRQGGETEKRRR